MFARLCAVSVAAAACLAPAAVLACEGDHASTMASVGSISAPELASLLEKKGAKLKVVDANSSKTRASEGVIPGAILLTSLASFDPAKELSAAKTDKVVFYCHSEKCASSRQAADKALQAGFTDVAVMPEGIVGWKAAGKKVATPQS